MANDGLEKITEIPVEFLKEGTTFLNKCTKPDGPGKLTIEAIWHQDIEIFYFFEMVKLTIINDRVYQDH